MKTVTCDRCHKEIYHAGPLTMEDLKAFNDKVSDMLRSSMVLGHTGSKIKTYGNFFTLNSHFHLCGDCTNDLVHWIFEGKKGESDGESEKEV